MKAIITYFILTLFVAEFCGQSFAQEQPVQGIVFDKDSKQRISKVYIYNLRTSKGVYNNLKGEFTLPALKSDTLVIAATGFRVDTITIKSFTTVAVYLKRTSILLKEILLKDTVLSPAERFAKSKEDYKDIYRKGNASDLISLGGSNGIGAGLSIDALYSLFSREGKNARFLQKILERDYREAIIDYRYTKSIVGNATGLSGKQLEDFMQQYRPSYYFAAEANDYSLIDFIKTSYKSYIRNPGKYRLPPLKLD